MRLYILDMTATSRFLLRLIVFVLNFSYSYSFISTINLKMSHKSSKFLRNICRAANPNLRISNQVYKINHRSLQSGNKCHLSTRMPIWLKCSSSDPIESSPNYSELQAWGDRAGIIREGWEIHFLPAYGIGGGVAVRDILPGEVLVRVPVDAAFVCSSKTEIPSTFSSFADERAWLDCPSCDFRIALRILFEKSLSNRGKWHAYLQSLPPHVPSLLHYSEEELSLLQCPRLLSSALDAQKLVQHEYERLAPLFRVQVSREDWTWAVDISRSRTFELPAAAGEGATARSFGVFPISDMLNHRFGSTSLRRSPRGDLEVLSAEGFAAGDQVVISYGAYSNDELLASYGFVDDENDVDFAEIPAATLAAAAAADLGGRSEQGAAGLEGRLAWLRQRHGCDCYKLYRGGEEEALMEAARLLTMSDAAFSRTASSAVELAARGGGSDGADNNDLEADCRAWEAVAEACRLQLGASPTSLEEDESLLAEMQEPPAAAQDPKERRAQDRRLTAVLYRALKKALLAEGAARAEYYAATSRSLGRPLQASVMEIRG